MQIFEMKSGKKAKGKHRQKSQLKNKAFWYH